MDFIRTLKQAGKQIHAALQNHIAVLEILL